MTQHINTGGPAFPSHEAAESDYRNRISGGGMSLRDWFAGKAMQGMLAASENYPTPELADYAYQVADAMLRAREVKQ